MSARLFVLPTQNDIIDFRLGFRPANILVRDFASEAEMQAYQEGIAACGDEYERIDNLQVVGATLTYTRRSDDPEIEAVAGAAAVEFATPAEAEAFRQGLSDAEGLAAPLLIDATDDRFELLLEWTAESAVGVGQ